MIALVAFRVFQNVMMGLAGLAMSERWSNGRPGIRRTSRLISLPVVVVDVACGTEPAIHEILCIELEIVRWPTKVIHSNGYPILLLSRL